MEESIKKFFDYIGEDREREGLLDTPNRVIESWKHLYSGYKSNPREILDAVLVMEPVMKW